MLAELFWPKEMKELVAKYRAEGILNEGAVQNEFKTSVIFVCLYVVTAIFFSYLTYYSFSSFLLASGTCLMILLCLFFIHKAMIKHNYLRLHLPLTQGYSDYATVSSFEKDHLGARTPLRTRILHYEFKGKKYRWHPLKKDEVEFIKSQGDKFQVLVNPANEQLNIPFLPSLDKKYNLIRRGN